MDPVQLKATKTMLQLDVNTIQQQQYGRGYWEFPHAFSDIIDINTGEKIPNNYIYTGDMVVVGEYAYYLSYNPNTRFYKYHIENNTWEELAADLYNHSGCQLVYKEDTSEFFVAGGGVGNNDDVKTIRKYNILTNTWTKLAVSTWEMRQSGAALWGDYIFITGTYISNTEWANTGGIVRYSITLNTYTQFTTLSYSLAYSRAFLINDKIHVFGSSSNTISNMNSAIDRYPWENTYYHRFDPFIASSINRVANIGVMIAAATIKPYKDEWVYISRFNQTTTTTGINYTPVHALFSTNTHQYYKDDLRDTGLQKPMVSTSSNAPGFMYKDKLHIFLYDITQGRQILGVYTLEDDYDGLLPICEVLAGQKIFYTAVGIVLYIDKREVAIPQKQFYLVKKNGILLADRIVPDTITDKVLLNGWVSY